MVIGLTLETAQVWSQVQGLAQMKPEIFGKLPETILAQSEAWQSVGDLRRWRPEAVRSEFTWAWSLVELGTWFMDVVG